MTSRGPTLTDAKGMGGLNAQDGFDYQVWDALIRLPAWLQNPAFEGLLIEGLEDAEARFFAPHAPRGYLLDRFQSKSGVLTRGELKTVLESFAAFEAAHPRVARVQTLVTPALPADLRWVARDPDRVRRARPFYAPFADIGAASDQKLRDDLVGEFGATLGGVFAESVEVMLRPLADRATAVAAFGVALHDAFPALDVGSRATANAFGALDELVGQSRGVMLTRERLLATLRTALGVDLVPDTPLRVHVRSDRNAPEADAIEIDAADFSGVGGAFPAPERWQAGLVVPLQATARWAIARGYGRVALSGSYRLSTAFTLGWAFRSAAGFEIDIPTRSGPWATDERVASPEVTVPWRIAEPDRLVNGRLVVGVGVLRDPSRDIVAARALPDASCLLAAVLPQPLTDGREAQASAELIKRSVGGAVARLRPAGVDVYYVGPAAFAVALGHRWNAMPTTQLYEFVAAEQQYTETVQMG